MFLTVNHDENWVTNTQVVSSSNSSQSCTMIHLPISHLYTPARQKHIVTKNPNKIAKHHCAQCTLVVDANHYYCSQSTSVDDATSLVLCSVHISRWCHVINLKSNFSPCYDIYLFCLMLSNVHLPFTFNSLKSIMSLFIFCSFKIPLPSVFKSSWSQRALGVDSTMSRNWTRNMRTILATRNTDLISTQYPTNHKWGLCSTGILHGINW